MELHYDLGFEVASCVLCLICLLYLHFVRRVTFRVRRTLFWLIVVNILLTSIFDLIALVIEHGFGGNNLPVMEFGTTMFFIMHNHLAPMFVCYIMCMTGTMFKMQRLWRLLFWIPCLIAEALIFSNPLTHYIFLYRDGVYMRHNLTVLVLVSFLYVLLGIVDLVRNWKGVPPSARFGVLYTLILYITGFSVQMAFPYAAVEMFITSLSVVSLMYMVEKDHTMFDQITQIPNAHFFGEFAKNLLNRKIPFRFILVHLPNLKYQLCLLSSEEGERFRREVAKWFQDQCKEPFTVICQLQEDRIGIFTINDDGEQQRAWVGRIKARMEKPWIIEGHQLQLRSVVLPMTAEDTGGELKSFRHLVAYENYVSHKVVDVLGEENLAEIHRRLAIERCIRRVLENDGIQVYYQPIWSSKTNTIISCEALLRVQDEEIGFVRPDLLVQVAEKNGSINAVDLMVLRKVCQFIREKKPEQYGLQYIEVNMSLYELLSPDLVRNYLSVLEQYQVPVSMINVEFTETLDHNQEDFFTDAKQSMRDAGFRFSLDDFGTEFSNMNRLFNNDFLNIKIDKSLLWDADKNDHSGELLAQLTRMLRRMGFNVLQEGVETREQLDFVTKYGCNLVQGYYFSKPLPEEEFLKYLKNFNSRTAASASVPKEAEQTS